MGTRSTKTTPLPWSSGRWTHDPLASTEDGPALVVRAAGASDAWRTTSYGFVHDSEHALVRPVSIGAAVEVVFAARFLHQFDQAGLFVRADAEHWIKAGVELVDGTLQLGAVVTNEVSDWSVAPVPSWSTEIITLRASFGRDAVTIRARVRDEAFRFVRLAPLPRGPLEAGPFCCAPSGAGLEVTFHAWRENEADEALHGT